MAKRLVDIKTSEVSLVDKPANKRPFLFLKRDDQPPRKIEFEKAKSAVKIEIETDGTIGGTKVTLNGDPLGDVRDFSFSFYGSSDPKDPVHCSITRFVDSEEGGFKSTETLYLAKGESAMNAEMMKSLVALIGDQDQLKAQIAKCTGSSDGAETQLAGALTVLKSYSDDFPADLQDAIGTLSVFAASSIKASSDVTKGEEGNSNTSVDDRIDTLTKTVEQIAQHVMPASPAKKSDDGSNGQLAKLQETVDKLAEAALTKSQPTATAKSETDEANSTATILKGLADRIEVLEKTPVSKKTSVTSQEGDEGTVEKSDGPLWPSLVGQSS